MDTSKVTRFEVIGQSGRLLTAYARVTVVLQDDDRTLKVFMVDVNDDEIDAVRRAHEPELMALLDANEVLDANED